MAVNSTASVLLLATTTTTTCVMAYKTVVVHVPLNDGAIEGKSIK